jgi:peptidoglycan-N-acetylglucosamine deacetylase
MRRRPPGLLGRVVDRVLGSIIAVDTAGRPFVALTFDDGPGPATEAVLDALGRYDARATFFVCGRNVGPHESVLRRARDQGHAIGNHTFHHALLPGLGARAIWREIRDGRRAIEDAIGVRTTLFRPPFGPQSLQSFLLARASGHRVICWSVTGDDWAGESASLVAGAVKARVQPGAIILLHDRLEAAEPPARPDRAGVVEALPLILDHLGALGIRSLPIPELLRMGRPRRVAWFGRAAIAARRSGADGPPSTTPRRPSC